MWEWVLTGISQVAAAPPAGAAPLCKARPLERIERRSSGTCPGAHGIAHVIAGDPAAGRFLPNFTDLSDFLGRLQPSKTTSIILWVALSRGY